MADRSYPPPQFTATWTAPPVGDVLDTLARLLVGIEIEHQRRKKPPDDDAKTQKLLRHE